MRLRRRGAGARNWLLVAILGLGEIAAAALTERQPGDKAGAATGVGGSEAPTTPSSPAGTMPEPVAATPPLETPGPSVTPPATPESDVERSERIDAALVDESASDDALVAKQEAAAAAEAAAIGGYAPSSAEDPAMEPVYQAGGGEQDGWEEAERDLIEHATHDDAGGDPTRDAFRPEVEADRATVVYGEADHVDSTEVVDDSTASPEDPGQGPGLGSGRGGRPGSSG